ncbi:hypothetical protein [Qipengyuania sp. ASV99]|uniref:hypothetical protein n=1 Tax=Qipengyuania sp. ASV99 TaxID=3399681 RepID=UPI003A4C7A6E
MRPDRIILGELRGIEAFTFLRAGLHRASRIDDHHPRRHTPARDRTTGSAGAAGRIEAQPR